MEKDNRFTDYLFNEFLELERHIGKGQSHRFFSIISNYIKWGFNYDNPEKAKQYAQMIFSSIEYAVFNWKTHLLDLKEENGQDAKNNVKKYIKRLRYLKYSEDEIANLLIEKYKLNNPSEVISPYDPL